MESKVGFLNKDQDCFSDLWSHQLQQDIIDLILQRLGALDRISFAAVCTCWRAALARSMSTSAFPFPFVLHPYGRTHLLSSLDDNRVYYLNPHNKIEIGTCLGIIEGRWLIMLYQLYRLGPEDARQKELITHYSILNPVTRKEFLLPTWGHSPISDTCKTSIFAKMQASSEPTTSNCIVAGLSRSGFLVGFCRLTDSKWTLINLEDEFKHFECHEIMFCHGKLYVLTVDVQDFIIAFDYNDNENGVYKAHKIVMTVPWQIKYRIGELRRLKKGLVSHYSFYTSYTSLATDSVSGELLLIVCGTKLLSKKSPSVYLSLDFCEENLKKMEVISLDVYKLNMINDQGQWIKVTDLGDRMLFYGNCFNFFISTKAFEPSTHQENCIYYALSISENCSDVGKFCLNDQTIIRYPIKRRNACGWLAPQFTTCEFYF